jgi:hypothetical protein
LGDEKIEIVDVFCLLSSCHRHLFCLFVASSNICRNGPKTKGLKTVEFKRYGLETDEP